MTVSNCNDDDPIRDLNLNEVQAAIEASTLGTPHARAMRSGVTRGVAENAVARLQARLTAKGLPGGTPAPLAEADSGTGSSDLASGSVNSQNSVADNGGAVAGDPIELPTEEIASQSVAPEPVSPTASSPDRLGPVELEPLVEQFFARPETVILVDPRREEVLIDIADYIEEITGQDASTIGEAALLREELGLDSLDAQQMVQLIEENYEIDIPPVQFHQLHTVADIISAILAIFDGTDAEPAAPTCEVNGATPASPWNLFQ